MGWSFGPLEEAKGIKGKGPHLTFDPQRLLSDLIKGTKKFQSRTNTQQEYSKPHIHTLLI